MKNPAQPFTKIWRGLRATITCAMAMLCALAMIAMQPAQAQTLSVLHNFTGGNGGSDPMAGLTIDRAG